MLLAAIALFTGGLVVSLNVLEVTGPVAHLSRLRTR